MTELITPLEWDSEFFGLKIGRAMATNPSAIAAVRDLARADDFDCVYLLLDGDDFDGRNAALTSGFRSVGQRVTYRAEELPASETNRAVELRAANRHDLEQLQPIASAAFRDSRFFWDPVFSAEQAAALYATWLRKSVIGGYSDATFCAVVDGKPAGFVTCDIHERDAQRIGQIGLIGVGPGARGRGVGSALVERAHAHYRSAGAEVAEVVTHGTNLAAQRLYSRYGYLPHRIQSWFHWWSD